MITSLQTGGAETLVVNMMPRFRALGHELGVVVFNANRTPLMERLERECPDCRIYRLGTSYYNPWYIVKLMGIMRKYDIVHTHNSSPQLFVAIANLICRKKLVTTEHNTHNRKRDIKLFAFVDKWMYRQYDSVICISDIAESKLREYLHVKQCRSVSRQHICTINNGVDVAVFHDAQPIDRKSIGSSDSRFVTVMVAGFREAKDQDTLIRAIASLPKDRFELWLVGDGIRRPELEQCIREVQAEEQVRLLGLRTDVPKILKAADVVVMSSHWEGLSLSNIEGMSAGKPFVASNVNGLREVTDGYGLLFPHGDAAALADIIKRLHDDRLYYELVAKRCYERAQQFDIQKMVEAYHEIYEELQKDKPKIIRACTVSMSIGFVEGMLPDLKEKYEVVLLSSPGTELREAVGKHGVRGIAVPMERHIAPVKDFVSLCRLISVLRREKPWMIHSMTPKAGLLCMLAAWLTRVPVRIHTFTGLVWPTEKGLKRRILMATDWLTCACATHVIPEGEGVKLDLLGNRITQKPLKVLGYGNVKGIDMQRFSRRDEVMQLAAKIRNDSVFTFIFVGRIVGDKGINELVAAFARLNKDITNTQLNLVGRFEEKLDPVSEWTKNTIHEHPCIQAVGSIQGDELLAYYAAADCYIHPSYREGFPNTVLEAGAMGLPSIVTDINGSREIIIGDENGLIVPPRNENALYEAMLRMVHNTEERERMAGNARQMIADRFEQGFVRKCLYDFYDAILKT